MEQADTSGKRFLYTIHQFKHLGTGQPEISRILVMSQGGSGPLNSKISFIQCPLSVI